MYIKSNLQTRKILYGVMLLVMVIASSGVNGAHSVLAAQTAKIPSSSEVESQFLHFASGGHDFDYTVDEIYDITDSYALHVNFPNADSVQTEAMEAGNISIDGINPTPGTLVGENLHVGVKINSFYEIQEVKARVETLETVLVYSDTAYCVLGAHYYCYPGWMGNISLSGLARGTKLLTVTATDVFGGMAEAQTSFIYDLPPVLTIQAPIDQTVAHPEIQLTANCTDDDPAGCVSIIVTATDLSGMGYPLGYPVLIDRSATSIDEVVSLADFDGQAILLHFTAKDSAGQQCGAIRIVYIELSTKLTEIVNVNGPIFDVQPERILFLNQSSGVNILTIRNRPSGQETMVMNFSDPPARSFYSYYDYLTPYAYLTPKGTIFITESGSPEYISKIYDYIDDVLVDLSNPNSHYGGLKVRSNYAIWKKDSGLILRDLVSGTNITVSSSSEGSDVAVNGDVVFTSNNQIYRYRAGITTQLTNDTSLRYRAPLTDGINVVYQKPDISILVPYVGYVDTYAVVMYGESGEITLAPGGFQNPNIGDRYQVNNGWIAYTKFGMSGKAQVWTHSPSGENTQISFFGSSSGINGLAPNGEVAFVNGNRLYLNKPGLAFTDIGSSLGKSFWQNGQWYVVIGRSLFQVVSSVPFTISGNAGVGGATISYTDDILKTAIADDAGDYSFNVSDNWSGTVTPSKTGYTFTPASLTYTNVLAAQTGQNYTATAIAYTISGNAGEGGATLSYTDDILKTAITDDAGDYSFNVSDNWSGTVTPLKAGYIFSPVHRTYTEVVVNQTAQNYSATIIAFFADVPSDYWATPWIERVYRAGVIAACTTNPLMFCPESNVSRADMAVFLLKGKYGSNYTPPAATGTRFTDVPASHPQAAWIEQLYAEGITAGCTVTPPQYCPDWSVDRAQMSIFFLRMVYGSSYTPPPATGIFADVPLSAAPWIEKFYADGVTAGCSTSPLLYCPWNPVTRAQMAIFLARAFNLTGGNLAMNKPSWATSEQSETYIAMYGNDGNYSTRWSSQNIAPPGDQWWWVDLGTQTFDEVIIRWETAYAVEHFVGWSNDGITYDGSWYGISSPGTYSYALGTHTGRYIGVLMRKWTSNPEYWNYSFWELEVYQGGTSTQVRGTPAANVQPVPLGGTVTIQRHLDKPH